MIVVADRHHFIYDYIQSQRLLFAFSVTISQFWNLQFFKAIIPPFCISEKLTGIHVHMLNFLPAIYPLVLVIISCILIDLHARNFTVVRILWKPLNFLLSKTNIKIGTTDAVFHATASLVLLSYISVLSATSKVIDATNIHSSTGVFHKKVFFIDPTMDWLSHKSIPYLLIAGVIFILFTLIPSLLLCIYPTRVYRYLSRFLSARKRLAITAFAEALHSCFKDGLNGTRDYRALAGGTIFVVLLSSLTDRCFKYIFDASVSKFVETMVCMTLASVVTYLKPCKSAVANFSLGFHMILIGILISAINLWEHDLSVETYTLELIIIVTLLSSHVLVALWAGYTLTKHTLTRFGCQFHGKVTLSDMCLYRRHRGYQEMLP